MRKIFIGLIFLLFTSSTTLGETSRQEGIVKCNRNECSNTVMSYREYIRKLQHERAIIYNALNLSDEQIQVYEDMITTQAPCYEKDFNELVKEDFRLQTFKKAKVNECDIIKQRRIVKKLKNKLEKKFDKDTKSFKKCLNSQQRAKYSMIKKLQHDDIKKASHKKDYYKANPQLSRFGNPPSCED